MKITNTHGISLPLAVWLLHDDYDYVNEENYISATTLLKSTKQIILSKRVPYEEREVDVTDFLAARFGHAIHDSIEKAWRQSGVKAMKKLGYPDHIAENIKINPTDEEILSSTDIIPVWIEQRAVKEITLPNGTVFKIGGKFDEVIDGRLFDTKTTSVWTYLKGSKDEDYGLQGGIYKWLNPEKILSDHIYIQFIFTDWQRIMAKRDPNYPQHKAMEYPVPLPSMDEIEDFILRKVQELARLWNAPEESLPECTDKELWRNDPSYKYYSDPAKANDPNARSTKNFDNLTDANAFMREKGKGVVVTKLGEPKACEYCPAFNVCKQKDRYFAEGI